MGEVPPPPLSDFVFYMINKTIAPRVQTTLDNWIRPCLRPPNGIKMYKPLELRGLRPLDTNQGPSGPLDPSPQGPGVSPAQLASLRFMYRSFAISIPPDYLDPRILK